MKQSTSSSPRRTSSTLLHRFPWLKQMNSVSDAVAQNTK